MKRNAHCMKSHKIDHTHALFKNAPRNAYLELSKIGVDNSKTLLQKVGAQGIAKSKNLKIGKYLPNLLILLFSFFTIFLLRLEC